MEISGIIELMKAMRENGVDQVSLEQAGTKLELKRNSFYEGLQAEHFYAGGATAGLPLPQTPDGQAGTLAQDTAPAAAGDSTKTAEPDVSEVPEEKPGQIITAPVVGVYFSASSPDARPFVKTGSQVKKGDVLCIIEAMKLMNEVTSTVSGTVLEVLVRNGEKVEYGQPLMRIG